MIIKTPVLIASAIVFGPLSSLLAQDAARTPADLPSPLPKPGAPSPLPLPSPPPKPGVTPPPLPLPSPDIPESSRPDAARSPVDFPSPPPRSGSPAPLPSAAPEVPELSRLDEAFKRTSIGKAADENRQRVEIRQLQNRVLNDPAVIEAKHNSDIARTDLEKREYLRDYYNIYYDEMRRLASSEETKKAIDTMKADHLKLVDQPRVRPVPGATPPPVAKEKKAKAKKSRFGAPGR